MLDLNMIGWIIASKYRKLILEALSVIIQVLHFKRTGNRVFKMAENRPRISPQEKETNKHAKRQS